MQPLILSLTLICGLQAVRWTAFAQKPNHEEDYFYPRRETKMDVEPLAKIVCKTPRLGTKIQISHVHHISYLVQFLHGLTSEHKLYACRNLYLESLENLERVVTEANEDACGEEKIILIEDFHRKYVSKVSKYARQQKRGNKVPEMAKLFFMQYASKISSMCEKRAFSIIKGSQHKISDEDVAKLNELKKFTDALGMSDLSKGFKGTYLFWNMVDSLGLEADKKFAKYLDDGAKRINVQMKEGRMVRVFQALCQHKLRPAYSKVILPVLRLVDMGYYPDSERLLADEPKVRSQYLATQICETFLPVRVFEDEKLTGDQFVALEKDEAKRLPEPEVISGKLTEDAKIIDDIKPLPMLLDILVIKNVEVIKYNVASRAKIIGKMLRTAMKQVKRRMGSKLGKTLFKRGANKQLESVGGEALNKIDENQALVQEEDGDDDEGHRVRRSGFLHTVGVVLRYLVWIIYMIIVQAIKLAIFIGPPPFFIFSCTLLLAGLMFETDHTLDFIGKAFMFGLDIRQYIGLNKADTKQIEASTNQDDLEGYDYEGYDVEGDNHSGNHGTVTQ